MRTFLGKLTLNVGSIVLNNNVITIGMNLRVPVTFHTSLLESHFIHSIKDFSTIRFKITKELPSINIDSNSYLVSTLCNIFNSYTNSNLQPISIGGATYARAFNNAISFGPNLPNQKDLCHQTDEFIAIDHLIFCTDIYSKAIYELAKEDKL